jgi:uncharacterized protein YkwD
MFNVRNFLLFNLWNLISAGIVSLVFCPLTGCGKSGSKANQRAQDIQGNSLFVERTVSINQNKSDEAVRTVHQDVNGYRVSRGLQPLALNPLVGQVATAHSREMATGKVPFGHDGFEQRVKTLKQSLSFGKVAENVGYNMGYADAAGKAVKGWLHSPEHLKNIEGDFNLTGIGVAKNDKGEYYFTQIFLKQRK